MEELHNNVANSSNGGGGGMDIFGDFDSVTIANTTIGNNSTQGIGGGIDSNSDRLSLTGGAISASPRRSAIAIIIHHHTNSY